MDHAVSDSFFMRPASPRTVWRVALLWQATVLDVVTLKGSRGKLTMRTGEVLTVRTCGGILEIDGIGDVEADAVIQLAAGHSLVATKTYPESHAGGFSPFDSTLFHAAMIGAAVQACVVSALVLAPSPGLDSEPGAGMPGEWRRYLTAPGGTAPTTGTPMLNVVGRKPEESERLQPARTPGQRPHSPAGKALTLEQALDEMSRVLHLGNDGTELKEAIGDIAQGTARAPVSGADFGGLSPKDPVESGQGNGLVGAGESKLSELLHRRIADNDKRATTALHREPRPAIPVRLAEFAPEDYARLSRLDPEKKDAITQAVRRRENSVRACYESRGLAEDHQRAGKLTLELTLLPNGRVKDAHVAVDNASLRGVADCVERAAADWYLGDGLVEEAQPLSFPFILTPRKDIRSYDFSDDDALAR